ncbi:hypothetical protein JOB18_032649 [Solea senegalensis]|uniref:Uncharacterized protein n=1 Tax=Solea senegalensis TaxID=28829 RepID=A0AAV6Q1N4_SOLSE|nr:hypothetical protein JOB18_032649 [Solea senegalensis]
MSGSKCADDGKSSSDNSSSDRLSLSDLQALVLPAGSSRFIYILSISPMPHPEHRSGRKQQEPSVCLKDTFAEDAQLLQNQIHSFTFIFNVWLPRAVLYDTFSIHLS